MSVTMALSDGVPVALRVLVALLELVGKGVREPMYEITTRPSPPFP